MTNSVATPAAPDAGFQAHERLLVARQLRERGVFFSGVHLRRLEKAGLFPARVQISPNRVAWIASEVDAWIQERAAARGGVR